MNFKTQNIKLKQNLSTQLNHTLNAPFPSKLAKKQIVLAFRCKNIKLKKIMAMVFAIY